MAWSADQAGTGLLQSASGQPGASLGGYGIQALAGNGMGGQILTGVYDTVPGVAALAYALRPPTTARIGLNLSSRPAQSFANYMQLKASLRLQQTLGGGRIIGRPGATIGVGQTRIAVFDTATNTMYYGRSTGGGHLNVLLDNGLPGFVEGRVCRRLSHDRRRRFCYVHAH